MKRALVAVVVIACGPAPGTARRAATVPPPPSACPHLPPGFEPFAQLGFGDALYETALGGGEMALGRFFPGLEGRVVMATPVEVDGDADAPEMAAAFVPAGGTREGGFDVVHDFHLALFRCGADGFERLGGDLETIAGTEIKVLATQLIVLPDGTWGSSVRITHGQGAEMVMHEHVFGDGRELGVLEVGRSAVPDGGGASYWRVIDGSGWFPDGDNLRYLGLSYSYEPDVLGAKSLYLDAAVYALLDRRGLHVDDLDTDGWALFGAGEPPAWCRGAVRCARIDPDDAAVAAPEDTHLPYGWVASGWTTAAAARAAIEAVGGDVTVGDWAFLGLVDRFAHEEAPPGPDGQPPAAHLEFVRDAR
jgi:hypothetical protein